MLAITVSTAEQLLTDVSGMTATVRSVLVEENGVRRYLRDLEPSKSYKDVRITVSGKRGGVISPPVELRQALCQFMETYHARQDVSFDCYKFACTVKGVPCHEKCFMLNYWSLRRLWFKPAVGTVVFYLSDDTLFHHAAVYIGYGLCISVWGAGGDLEVASLKSMKKDFGAERIFIAEPRF